MNQPSSLDIIILAAGKGTRMRSALPKVLQTLAGKPILAHLIATTQALMPRKIYVVVGRQAELIKQTFADSDLHWVTQDSQQGTGHAVAQVLPYLPADGKSLIIYGDVPLITLATLEKLIHETTPNSIGVLTASVENPKGMGRIIRDDAGKFLAVVEEVDTSPTQRMIDEINAGIYVIPNNYLHQFIPSLTNDNAKKNFIYRRY